MLKLPPFKAAAVQPSPVYLNARATAEKAASLVREAAANGRRAHCGSRGGRDGLRVGSKR